MSHGYAGSFDFVRLASHFAQDDRVDGQSVESNDLVVVAIGLELGV
jgi:hypothetical protein